MAQTFNQDILLAALAGFKLEQQQLEDKIAQVQAMLAGSGRVASAVATEIPTGNRKKRSAAVRRRMAEAQKARWAKLKGESELATESVASKPVKPKHAMTKASQKAIVAAGNKRRLVEKGSAAARTHRREED